MFKNIPNILSISRIIFAAIIIIFANDKLIQFIAFVLSGITDILDGYLARKFNCATEKGAKLDSLGDLVIITFVIIYFIIWEFDLIKWNITLIAIIIIIRFLSVIVCWSKNGQIYGLHTFLNKFIGFVVFIGIAVFFLTETFYFLNLTLWIALISAIEELIIFLKVTKPDINTKSILTII